MNYSIIKKILGKVLEFEAAFLMLPCVTALIYKEWQGLVYLAVAAGSFAVGWLLSRDKNVDQTFFAKEGFVMVALSWIVMSVVGALPFTLCGDIPSYVDALFETISGFTTTGASILTDVEALCHTSLLWRSFTHWVGGMGVFVFLLAILPMSGGYSMHIMRAESPGPSVGKLVPRIKDTAKILYGIYIALTLAQMIILIIAGCPVFDSVCTAFGTAGTGGFGIKNDSFAGYVPSVQIITTVFMLLFGVNFNAYFFLLGKDKKQAFRMEEVRCYFAIVFASIIVIAINIFSMTDGIGDALNKASFQVASIVTTTGFATTDFNLWPQLSKTILVALMFMGACAGSTGGGIKVSRIMILFRSVKREIRKFIHPRSVTMIKMDGKTIDSQTVSRIRMYLITYTFIFLGSMLLIALDDFDFTTNFTAVAATFNNIGPGLNMIGPTGNYSSFGVLSKLVLMFDMIAGRLELFPMIMLFTPSLWRRKK